MAPLKDQEISLLVKRTTQRILKPFTFSMSFDILLCSSNTDEYARKMQCFKYSDGNWVTFAVDGDISTKKIKFISAVNVPNVGIWFMGATSDGKSGVSFILHESGKWKNGPDWTNVRQRACSVLISDTKVAHIGGEKGKWPANHAGLEILLMYLIDS